MSGISGCGVPDSRLGNPNPNFGSGSHDVALWPKKWKDYLTHNIYLFISVKMFVFWSLKHFRMEVFVWDFVSWIKINMIFQSNLYHIIKLQLILHWDYNLILQWDYEDIMFSQLRVLALGVWVAKYPTQHIPCLNVYYWSHRKYNGYLYIIGLQNA